MTPQSQPRPPDAETVKRFAALFAGNTRFYGTYQNVGTERRTDGKLYGKAETVFGDPSALYAEHLEGITALGIAPITDSNECLFGAVDIDIYDGLDHRDIARKLRELSLPLIPCRSKSGGVHVYLFAQSPVPAATMRTKLKEIATALGYKDAELFPKQTAVDPERAANWINLPLFAGDEGLRWPMNEAGQRLMLDEFLPYAEARRVSAEFFAEQSAAPAPPLKTKGKKQPWDDDPNWRGRPMKMLVDEALAKVDEGEFWNTTGFNLACYLRDERYMLEEALPVFQDEWFAKVNAVNTDPAGYDWEKHAVKSLRSAYSDPPRDPRPTKGKNKKDTHLALLMALISDFEYFHSGPTDDPFVRVTVDDHHETWPASARSTKVRELITHRFLTARGTAPSRDALNSVLDTVAAKCSMGPHKEVHVRFARSLDKIYVDLCDSQWRAVEIDKGGWRIVDNPPVHFRRPSGARPLPAPVQGGSLTPLRELLNCANDDQWILTLSWLVGVFLPQGAFTHLALAGEQGSSKSTSALVLSSVLDPSEGGLSGPPKDEADATIAALHSGILAFDNLSGCRGELADVFCRFSTGQGYRTRTLYTNLEQTVISLKRPLLLNGIDSAVLRGDLLDRSIVLTLPRIAPENRRTEQMIWDRFAEIHPGCLGALLTAVSQGLRNLPDTTVPDLPRMADFCRWVVACEPALPWRAGEFMARYRAKIVEAGRDLAESDSLTAAIVEWAYAKQPRAEILRGFETTAKVLLTELNAFIEGSPRDAKFWPASPEGLAHRIPRIAPLLRSYGVEIERLARTGATRSRWRVKRDPREGEQIPMPKAAPLFAEFQRDAVSPEF